MTKDEELAAYLKEKQNIKFHVLLPLGLFLGFAGLLIGGINLVFMPRSAANLNSDIAQIYMDILAPALQDAIQADDHKSEKIAQEFQNVSYLKEVVYAALLDKDGAIISEWKRDPSSRFSAKEAKKLESGEKRQIHRGFYVKKELKNTSGYTVIIAFDSLILLKEQITDYGSLYAVFLCMVLVLVAIAVWVVNTHVIKPLVTVSDKNTEILEKNDLTIVLPLEAHTEIGQMTIVINTITEKMRTMLLTLGEISLKFIEVVQELTASGTSVSEGALVIQQQAANTNEKMAALASSFNAVAAKLRDLSAESERGSTTVYEMSQVNQEVFDNVTAMSSAVTQSIAAIEEMTGAIEKTSGHVSRLNNDIESVNSAMQRLDSSIAIEEKSAGDSIATAEELSENAESGMQALKETINGISKIEESSAETAEVIAALGKHAMNIGNILHVIDDVTKQTNLLALNAAIISAQAGEHGRGFAVVAEEIGALAGRTKDSTKEIAELITTIQAETERAVKVMGESKGVIAAGAKLGKEAQEAFDKLRKSADKSIEQAKALAKATAEQASDVRAVTGAIESITGTVGEINSSAQNQAQGAAALNKAAEKMNLLNQQVAKSSEEQARSAKDVLKAIQNISEMSAAVSKYQDNQTAGTNRALELIGSVDNYASLQDNSSKHLAAVIGEINSHIGKLAEYVGEFKI